MLSSAYDDYAKALNAHAFFKLNNHTTADDITQETFLKTWRFLVRYGKIDVMKSFLYRVINCLIIDEYWKRKTLSLDELLETGFEPIIDH